MQAVDLLAADPNFFNILYCQINWMTLLLFSIFVWKYLVKLKFNALHKSSVPKQSTYNIKHQKGKEWNNIPPQITKF